MRSFINFSTESTVAFVPEGQRYLSMRVAYHPSIQQYCSWSQIEGAVGL